MKFFYSRPTGWDEIGRVAVRELLALIHTYERGIPPIARTILIRTI